MSGWALILWTILRAIDLLLDELARQRVKKEVRQEQRQVDDDAAKAADQIDADVLASELDALRERMRDYQRTTP